MKLEIEKALRIKCIAHEMLEILLEDRTSFKEEDLKLTAEYLARSIHDLVNVYTDLEQDHETCLKGTISKMRTGYNNLYYGKKKQSLENENV